MLEYDTVPVVDMVPETEAVCDAEVEAVTVRLDDGLVETSTRGSGRVIPSHEYRTATDDVTVPNVLVAVTGSQNETAGAPAGMERLPATVTLVDDRDMTLAEAIR